MPNSFVEYENVVPLLVPQDIAGTATPSDYLDLAGCHEATIFVYFGGITTASADQTAGPVVTIEAATGAASASNEVNVEFEYRISAATGTNTWVSKASASAGVDLTVTGDGKMLAIHIDPAKVQALLTDARYVRAVITPGTGGATCLVAVWAVMHSRYKMTTMVSDL
jgi:hypothetical protein